MSRWRGPFSSRSKLLHLHPPALLAPGNPLKSYSGTEILTFSQRSLLDGTKTHPQKQLRSLPNTHQWSHGRRQAWWSEGRGGWAPQPSRRWGVGLLAGWEGVTRTITVRSPALGTLRSNCLPESLSAEGLEEHTRPWGQCPTLCCH